MRTVMLHQPGKLMMAEFSGKKALMAAERIRAALERAKEAVIQEKNVPIIGEINNHREEMELSVTMPRGNVLLGAGHIFLKTSSASFMRRILNSMIYIADNGLQMRGAEPSYSTGYALGLGGSNRITVGSSSLRTALGIPIDREYHAKIRDIVRKLFGVDFTLREIVLAFPCDSLLALSGDAGRYAILGQVPLERITLLSESGRVVEFCRAEAQAEILRAGEGASARKIAAELVERMSEMDKSKEKRPDGWS